ncbi:MAG: DUF4202 domain-containing protein [Acidobacteria bacterium]|nr:DUF4202 domain-containing protein [Acidobacteriota bacterium]
MARRFEQAIGLIDEANGADPNQEIRDGERCPKELLYSQRMTEWLERLEPGASEVLRLAARAQHIRRWEIPRGSYPMNRQGYRAWRTELGRFHARTVGALLGTAGYEEQTIERVGALLRKEHLKTDPDCQTLEDVICLVFLENHFEEFAQQHDEEKLLNIVRRTWMKMSERGHKVALELRLPEAARSVVEKALR